MAGGKDLRLFVAAYPPVDREGGGGAREWLRRLRKMEPPLANHRPTPLEQVHLTLQFIGDTPAGELEGVIESVERSASGIEAFELTPVRFMTLPARGRPRLVALETDAPAGLLELQRRLATRLARKVRGRPGDRFLPHFTLCRFAHGAKPRDVDEAAAYPAFAVEKIALVRSVLRPSGAEHSVVREVPLVTA